MMACPSTCLSASRLFASPCLPVKQSRPSYQSAPRVLRFCKPVVSLNIPLPPFTFVVVPPPSISHPPCLPRCLHPLLLPPRRHPHPLSHPPLVLPLLSSPPPLERFRAYGIVSGGSTEGLGKGGREGGSDSDERG